MEVSSTCQSDYSFETFLNIGIRLKDSLKIVKKDLAKRQMFGNPNIDRYHLGIRNRREAGRDAETDI